MTTRTLWGRIAPLAAGLGLLLQAGATTALAQAASPAPASTNEPKKEETVKLDEYIVTGSYIPYSVSAPAIPVTTVRSADIAGTGVNSSLLEVLRKAVPQFVGNGNLGATNANISSGSTNGGSQLSLYNAQTLVLVNGRRVAFAPVGASGGYVFVDVNLIPMSAVERVDVVTDGASATYGSDAVSGVVNIILKSNYDGTEIGGRYGVSTNDGRFEERSAYFVTGAAAGKTNITVSAEWYKQDPIYNYERPFAATTYGTGTFPGSVSIGSSYYYLNPTLNAPSTTTTKSPADLVAAGTYSGPLPLSGHMQYFNLSKAVTMLQSDERQSATIALDRQITEDLTMFGDLLYSNTNTFSQLNGQPFSASIAAGVNGNPFNVKVTARNRFIDHPRTYSADTKAIRGVLGFRGNFTPDWHWEVGANYNQVDQDYVNGGLINTANRIAAVADGTINMFARTQAAGALEASGMLGTALGFGKSKLITYDARVNGKLATLPGGDLQMAVGAEHRIESLGESADVNSQAATFGWDSGTTLDPFQKSRTVNSVFAEVRAPLLAKVPGANLLELSAAVRHEAYSDTSDPTVPKVTLKWLPFSDDLAIRATWGKSFSAPTLFSLFGPASIGFTENLDGQIEAIPGHPAISGQANGYTGSNPNLRPSLGKNLTVGLVYSPKAVKGLSVSLDYFRIKQTDLISSIGAFTILQDVETYGAASPYANLVKIGGFNGTAITAPGQISGNSPDDLYVTDQLINIAKQTMSGFNATAKYTFTVAELGKFDLNLNGILWDSYKVQFLPTTDPYETAGLVTNTNGTLNRWKAYFSGDWERGNWGAGAGVSYWTAVTDDNDGSHIPPVMQVDLSVGYKFDSSIRFLNGLKMTVGVNNVFNKFPPLDPTTFSDSNTDIATYGPIGRLIYLKASYKF